jgi:hypothetical protein
MPLLSMGNDDFPIRGNIDDIAEQRSKAETNLYA